MHSTGYGRPHTRIHMHHHLAIGADTGRPLLLPLLFSSVAGAATTDLSVEDVADDRPNGAVVAVQRGKQGVDVGAHSHVQQQL